MTCKNRKAPKRRNLSKSVQKLPKIKTKKSKEIRRKFFNLPNKNQEVLNKKHSAVTRAKNLIYLGKRCAVFISKSMLCAFMTPSFHIQKTTRYITGNIEKPKLDIPLLTLDNT